jgi:F0F1-type ATP synthase assembly protein I|tara:strand:- start:1679 stop:1864 length:186 start_codon:yes stop_codon:yes gene_type:complete
MNETHIITYFVFWFFIIFLLLFQCARVAIINKEKKFQREDDNKYSYTKDLGSEHNQDGWYD